MDIFVPIEATEEKIKNNSITNGAFYVSNDTFKIFADLNGKRLDLTDIIFLNTDTERIFYNNPAQKLYIVKENNSIWIYNEEWVQLNSNISEEVFQSALAKKQDKLIAGSGINISGNVISSTGSSESVTVDLNLRNNIISAPNGIATFSGNVITVKSGLTFNYSAGISYTDYQAQYRIITLPQDVSTTIDKTTDDGIYVLFVSEEYDFVSEPYNLSLISHLKDKTIFSQNTSNSCPVEFCSFSPQYNRWGYSPTKDSYVTYYTFPVGEYELSNGKVLSFTPYYPVETGKAIDLIGKQDKLIAGNGINISGNVISYSGSSGSEADDSLNKCFINNYIIDAPNGVCKEFNNTITVKSGLRGKVGEKYENNIKACYEFIVPEDTSITFNDTENGYFLLMLRNKWSFSSGKTDLYLDYFRLEDVYFNVTIDTTSKANALQYIDDKNLWSYKKGNKSSYIEFLPIGEFELINGYVSNINCYYPLELAKNIDLKNKQDKLNVGSGLKITNNTLYFEHEILDATRVREGILEYVDNGISISGNKIIFKAGLKLLQPNGYSDNGKFNNYVALLSKDLDLTYAYNGSGTTPIYGKAFIIATTGTARVQNDYIYEQEETPPIKSGFVNAWYKPSINKWHYATGSAVSWSEKVMCPVCDFTYDRKNKIFTEVIPYKVIQVALKSDIALLQKQIDELKAGIASN